MGSILVICELPRLKRIWLALPCCGPLLSGKELAGLIIMIYDRTHSLAHVLESCNSFCQKFSLRTEALHKCSGYSYTYLFSPILRDALCCSRSRGV